MPSAFLTRSVSRFALVLLSVEFLDELAAGVPGSGASGIQAAFGSSHTAMGALVTAFGLLAIAIEPPLFFLADRFSKRYFVCGGLFVLGVASLSAAAAPSYAWLFVSLLLYGPSSGLGVSLSQATVIDLKPGEEERWLTRWTLAGELGDLMTPALVATMLALGSGWRGAFAFCGVVACSQAVVLFSQRSVWLGIDSRPAREGAGESATAGASQTVEFGDGEIGGEIDEEVGGGHLPWRESMRLALTNRALLVWSLALVACSLLDEILVVFAMLRMTLDLKLSQNEALFVIACFGVGGIVALLFSERVLRRISSLRLLAVVCFVSLGAHVAFVFATELPQLVVSASISGAAIGLQYPLAKAQLYRALPGRTGTALAVSGLFGPVELVLPVALGLLADHFGLMAALLLLGLQPVCLLAALWLTKRLERSGEIA